MSPGADDNTSDCVLCGKCLEVCPLLAATGREELSPRAKAHLVTLLESDPELLREQDVAALAGLCLGCGRCKEVCSQGVNIPEAVSRLREKHPGWKSWLWKQWMKHADTLWPAAGKIASKVPARLGPERLSGLLKMARSLDRKPIAPFVHINSFPDQFQHTEALLFPGCAAGGAQGDTNEGTASYWTTSAQALCRGLGISIIEAQFGCCGSGLQGAGLRHERLDAALRNVDIWRAAAR